GYGCVPPSNSVHSPILSSWVVANWTGAGGATSGAGVGLPAQPIVAQLTDRLKQSSRVSDEEAKRWCSIMVSIQVNHGFGVGVSWFGATIGLPSAAARSLWAWLAS